MSLRVNDSGTHDVTMFFFFQAEDGIRDLVRSRGLGDVYKRQVYNTTNEIYIQKIDPLGILLFGNNGSLFTSTSNSFSQLNAQRTSRGFMVTYADDAFPSNVYSAAMIDTGGNFVWANQTVAVATTASGKSNATLTEQKLSLIHISEPTRPY
mgnify:CR=1 FL=1